MCSLIRMSSSDLVLRIGWGRWMGWREGDLVAHGRVIERQISTTNGWLIVLLSFSFSFSFSSIFYFYPTLLMHACYCSSSSSDASFRLSVFTTNTHDCHHGPSSQRHEVFHTSAGLPYMLPTLVRERWLAGSLASSPTHSSFLFAGGGVLPLYLQNKKISRGREGGDGELAMDFFFFY